MPTTLLPTILQVAREDGSIAATSESLVRLGALERGLIGGLDVARKTAPPSDFGDCYEGPWVHDWDYEHRTFCVTKKSAVTLSLLVPQAVASAPLGVVVVIAARRVDAREPAELKLRIGDQTLPPASFDGNWSEQRFTLERGALKQGRVVAELHTPGSARFALDHVLLLPRRDAVLAQAR